MKPLIRCTRAKTQKQKQDTQFFAAKYWATQTKIHSFKRADGTIGKDKTRRFHSRPHKKQELRNSNRSITKRARQILKQEMLDDVCTSTLQ